MKHKRIYLSPPHLSSYERELVQDALDSNWIAPLGPHVDAFEREFIEYHGEGYAAAVSTGTAAMHLVLRRLGVGPGDKVFCSSLTFIGSVSPVIFLGAQPVFVDSEPSSWNMDPELLAEELENCAFKKNMPKAVIVVHLYGQCADMDPILEVCNQFEIPVIEDAAEAISAEYKGRKAGTMGEAGIFSFNGNKLITTSSGGMVLSKNEEIIDSVKYLATQAREPVPHYQHSEIGYNYRMSNILAAIGRGQLSVVEERIEQARHIFGYYFERLGKLPGIGFMPEPDWSRGNRWLTCITVNPVEFGCTREDVRIYLDEHNVESRPLWKPMHLQPVFRGCRMVGGGVSEELFENGLCLPSGTSMNERDLDFVCGLIEEVHQGKR